LLTPRKHLVSSARGFALAAVCFAVAAVAGATVKHSATRHSVPAAGAEARRPKTTPPRVTNVSTKTAKSTPASHKKASSRKKSSRVRGQAAPTTDRISEIQSALAKSGAYQGNPNGKWDDGTTGAMKRFQQANGLSPTGKLDAPTLQKLGLGSEIAGRAAPRPEAAISPAPSHIQN
jgi:peptidoglycan hydrolase-like protein with peptidoglycan-binding domain